MESDAHAQSKDAIDAVLSALLEFEVAQRTAVSDLARQFSLNHSELTALALLGRRGTQQVTQLAALLQLTAGSTSSLISRLSGRELILRRRSDSDRRGVELTLTDDGRDVVEAMHARFRAAVGAALAGASTDRLMATSGVLSAIAADLLLQSGADGPPASRTARGAEPGSARPGAPEGGAE